MRRQQLLQRAFPVRLSSGPYFSLLFWFAPTFPYFFLKMPYYPYFFTLKCHLRVRIQKLFLACFARSGFKSKSYFSSGSPPLKHNKIWFLTKKVSLFSQYYYHSSCPAYLVLNFVYLTNDFDDFCTWKNPTIPTFYTDNPYFFTSFSKFVSLLFPYFFVEGHLKACILLNYWLDFGQKVNEYDQEIPQSHTANQPTAPLQEWSFYGPLQ